MTINIVILSLIMVLICPWINDEMIITYIVFYIKHKNTQVIIIISNKVKKYSGRED